MNTILRNVAAFIIGVIVGGFVNMSLIMISPNIIPPPPGVDVTNAESIAASIHLFEPKHFLFPFLAHALGTLVGAFTASMIAASHRMKLAIGIGVFSLAGGIAAAFMIPAPTWFIVLDLVCAYIPMGWIGGKIAECIRPTSQQARSTAPIARCL